MAEFICGDELLSTNYEMIYLSEMHKMSRSVQTNYVAKFVLLTDQSAEDEFGHIFHLNTGFTYTYLLLHFICLRQTTSAPTSETTNSFQMDNLCLV